MTKVNRRKFLENLVVYNASLLIGTNFLCACTKDILGSTSDKELEYMPIQESNPAIAFLKNKCEECGDCLEACAEKQEVFGTYAANASTHVCINCGTCILACEEGALKEKYYWQNVLEAIDDPSKIVIASISPSVRVGIGDYFGLPSGSFMEKNLVGACKAAGFDYVLDTNFSADLTIMEEAYELQNRITENSNLPQFTSCCPAWVKYVEIYYPSLLSHLSTTRSPIAMQGALVKSYFAEKNGIDPQNIVHVAITPCSAKKYEITRDELVTDGMHGTNFTITTNELAKLLKNRNIRLTNQVGEFDQFMGTASGGGVIFGNTGGVMRAALRTAHFNITGSNPPPSLLNLEEVQGLSGFRQAKVTIGSISLNVAVCYEMRNARMLLEQVMNGSCNFDFIEVMACKGGCVGGAGQPADCSELRNRINALNIADTQASTRFCHENQEIQTIYQNFLGNTGSQTAKKYLHTSFNNKSDLLVTGE